MGCVFACVRINRSECACVCVYGAPWIAFCRIAVMAVDSTPLLLAPPNAILNAKSLSTPPTPETNSLIGEQTW